MSKKFNFLSISFSSLNLMFESMLLRYVKTLLVSGPARGSGGGPEAKYFQNYSIWKIVANLI